MGRAPRDTRPGRITVLDVQAPHIDTGLAGRPVHGEAPRLPRGADLDQVVEIVLATVIEGGSLIEGRSVLRPGRDRPLEPA